MNVGSLDCAPCALKEGLSTMTNRRTLIGLALGALLLVSSLSAATYSLPDAGVLAGGSVNTDLNVSNGTGQAAINLSIRYNPNVATPGTVVVGSVGGDGQASYGD